MLDAKKGEPKTYYIGFDGTSHFLPVIATSSKQAKEKFANYEGIKANSAYIVEKRKVDEYIKRMKPIV